jgi:hypothetical protein
MSDSESEKERYIVVRFPKLNDNPFEHNCLHGTVFKAERCDFKGGVKVTFRDDAITDKQKMADVAQMIGYHAVNIYPRLNGFSGYDCIQFIFE